MMPKEVADWWGHCAAPGLARLEGLGGPRAGDPRARQLMLAIALQESALRHRAQRLSSGAPGPARGWWQFERSGGVVGVLSHASSAPLAARLCQALYVPTRRDDVWRCLEGHDELAAGFARLLLWTDPRPLPELNDWHGAWQYYLSNWRPGKPHFDTWYRNCELAAEALRNA